MKWQREHIETARVILATAPTLKDGFAAVAKSLGCSRRAVSLQYERGHLGTIEREPPPVAEILEDRNAQARLRGEIAKSEALLKDLTATKEALEAISIATSKPLPRVKRRELKSGLREATAVFMLSDVHAEEPVRVGETPYPNRYDIAIADRSIGRYFAAVEWLIKFHRHAFQIRDVVFSITGDLSSGHIHEELKQNTTNTPLEMMLWWRPRLVAGIDRLLSDSKLETIQIVCSYGNHGRTTYKPYRSLGAVHNYEWALYQWLGLHYAKEKRVRILADASAHQYAHVYDFDLHFHHGDEVQYQGGVGGITIPLNKATSQWDLAAKCHFHHFGHWHQYLDTGRIAVNGSVIGYNAYAMSIKATPEPPQQVFYLLDSKRGKTCKSPVWVRETSDLVGKESE